MIRSLLLAVLFGAVFSQNYGESQYDPMTAQHRLELTFTEKILDCRIINIIGWDLFSNEDCIMFLYINNKRKEYVTGMSLQVKYTDLLISKVRCEATCENNRNMDKNILPVQIEINKMIFIGLCSGAGAAFILLVIAIVCGVWHCRGHYYKKVPDEGEPMKIEAQVSVEPTAPVAEPPSYKKSLDAELEAEVRKKKISESSESDSDEENVDGNLYNYNPNCKYNYAEMTSEI